MKVEAIDHVHVEVDDRDEAADWYGRVLGLVRYSPLASWAQDPMGPLILSTAMGIPTLSLFARARKPASRDNTIAFRVSAQQFLDFIDDTASIHHLVDRGGEVISGRENIVDHEYSWSFYFLDPYENRIELTTYDYAEVKKKL